MRIVRGVLKICLVIILVGAMGAPAGCNTSSSGPKVKALPVKMYHLRGRIVAVGASGNLTVDAGAIPGLMEAMTMSYKLVDPAVASELHTGDVITARVIVDDDPDGPINPRLDEIVVVGQARPDNKPPIEYHVPSPGDSVPDFKMVNQSGREIHLSQFRGKVLLLTFIYTRCPFADFCPKMSSNFAEIDKALAANKSIYGETHLLSMSFDPEYDTPKVLRSYGGAHTGRFTDEDFAHWDFAAPSVADLAQVEQWFDVGVTGTTANAASIQHSLSTVLIGKDGKVLAWYPSNDWKVPEVLATMEKAAA